jgi:SAM-dependent methyltransferase
MRTKSDLRSTIFRHLDGIVTAPTAFSLYKHGVLEHLLKQSESRVSEMSRLFKANEGYLNVALRVLCSQGWLTMEIDNKGDDVVYRTNSKSEIAFSLVPLYEDVVDLIQFSGKFHSRRFDIEPYKVWEKSLGKFRGRYGLQATSDPYEQGLQEQVLKHIEGVLAGPTIVLMGMGGMFHKYFMETRFSPDEFHENPTQFRSILDFFTDLGWFTKHGDNFQFTDMGMYFAKRATSYGVTVSYLPTFRALDELIFGNPLILQGVNEAGNERHVDREMNVWGSGGAHAGYFTVIDEIIIDIFNRPIDEQPKGILDMGCGNGAFLEHLFDVIYRQTKRGKMLDDYPLFLVGADYNDAALKVTRGNLIRADIWAKVIWGDIGRPDLLARDLSENYSIDLSDLLNVRTFLDHNRVWVDPTARAQGRVSDSTGAFASKGKRLSNADVEDNLREHFLKWTPYVSKHGLLLIELHTIDPMLTAGNLGKTAATAYDATHGFSDQYIVELEVFDKIMTEVGLASDAKVARKFPDSPLATVSVHLLKGKTL